MSYERLTQWNDNGASLILGDVQTEEEARNKLKEQFKKACNRLAELEDKLESGLLVELPCKVGDTVYYIHSYYGQNGIVYDEVRETKFDYIAFQDWGYMTFPTKEAAEARLKELQEGKK